MKSAMMRKLTIFAIVSLFCTISYAQRPGLKGLSVGLGIPIEFTDLEAAGLGFSPTGSPTSTCVNSSCVSFSMGMQNNI